MNYEVAIAIPTLNEERFISRCLDSIIKQTFKFEKMDVMIIDGGSNDKTKDIVTKLNTNFLHKPDYKDIFREYTAKKFTTKLLELIK